MKAYSHLSAEERIRIDELRNRDGLGVRQIALRIGRDKATVSRELKRGLWFASNENDSYRPYRPKRLKTGPWTCRPFYSCFASIFLKQFLHYFSAVWAAGFQQELHHMTAQTRTGTGPPCLYIPET